MHLLIDADSLIYKAACPCDTKMYNVYEGEVCVGSYQYKRDMVANLAEGQTWEHEVVDLEPVENALHNLKLIVEDILEETQPDDYTVFISRGKTFRHVLDAEYKAGRPSKPTWFNNCWQYLFKKYEAVFVEGLEADDLVAMYQTDKTCIAHIDKDLDTVAGLHYNYNHINFYKLSEHEALVNFYRQLLIGDRGDNIEGVKGIGVAKAKKHITEDMSELDMYNTALALYNNNKERLLLNGRLMHMTRELDAEDQPVLWEPPHGCKETKETNEP